MMDASKYAPGYYPAPENEYRWVKKDHIEQAPAWCSVDLRDGNQALVVPMSLEEKIEFSSSWSESASRKSKSGSPQPAKQSMSSCVP